jgi:hypothetical protein
MFFLLSTLFHYSTAKQMIYVRKNKTSRSINVLRSYFTFFDSVSNYISQKNLTAKLCNLQFAILVKSLAIVTRVLFELK